MSVTFCFLTINTCKLINVLPKHGAEHRNAILYVDGEEYRRYTTRTTRVAHDGCQQIWHHILKKYYIRVHVMILHVMITVFSFRVSDIDL